MSKTFGALSEFLATNGGGDFPGMHLGATEWRAIELQKNVIHTVDSTAAIFFWDGETKRRRHRQRTSVPRAGIRARSSSTMAP